MTAETTTPNATTRSGSFTIQHSSSYVLPFTEDWVIASTVIIVFFFIFGITANSITLAAIRLSSRLRNRYYLILSSLCVSDIISAIFSILFLYRRIWGFDFFAWPEFFCRLYWGVDLWTSFSTAFHILSFAILRLIGVRWPTKFKQIKSKHMKIWIGSIWTCTFLGGFIPHFIFNTVRVIDRNKDAANARWASCSLAVEWIPTWKIYVQIAYGFYVYLPALAILSISIAIAIILRKKRVPPGAPGAPFVSVSVAIDNKQGVHSKVSSATPVSSAPPTPNSQPSVPSTPVLARKEKMKSNRCIATERRWKKDKRAIYQLFLIVLSFLIGYIPLTAFHFYTGFTLNDSDAVTNRIDWKFAMVQYIILRFSECLNPVFYNLASKKMRKETKKMLKKMLRMKPDLTWRREINRHTRSSSDV